MRSWCFIDWILFLMHFNLVTGSDSQSSPKCCILRCNAYKNDSLVKGRRLFQSEAELAGRLLEGGRLLEEIWLGAIQKANFI